MPSALVETPDCFIYLQAFVRSAIMGGARAGTDALSLHREKDMRPQLTNTRMSPRDLLRCGACPGIRYSARRGDFAFGAGNEWLPTVYEVSC
jgi:hypothetical protein